MANDSYAGPGSVEVTKAVITSLSSSHTIDISRMINTIDIYGSIFDPTMVAVITLTDFNTTVYNLPVIGEEIVELQLETSGHRPLSKLFFVHKPDDVGFGADGSSTSMTLHLVSIEQMRAVATNVNLGIRGQLSTHVRNILKDYVRVDDSLTLNIEDTEGVEGLVIPGWNAWETIEFLRKRAVSTKYRSPFLFFEDSTGFNFESVEGLIERKKRDKPPETYTAEPFQVESSLDSQMRSVQERQARNVSNFKIVSKGNSIQMLNRGGLKNRVQVFNMLKKELSEVVTTYTDMKENVRVPLDEKYFPQQSSQLASILGENSIDFFVPVDGDNLTSSAENYGRKLMFSSHMGALKVTFTMCGNCELDPGDVVKIEVPRTTSSSDEDGQLTGNYLITNFCHHIADGTMMTDVEASRLGLATNVL